MMYPRLRLAKDLLTEDGVIFISIDDNEQCNLVKLVTKCSVLKIALDQSFRINRMQRMTL
ncbi:MAG: hypothetical protein ACLTBV_19575 [Enterocloster bolteae]